jgi:molybdenum cofactor cytidylyltransferase
MSTAVIVLAAGGSRRLGRSKQLVPYRGMPLLQSVVGAVKEWPVDTVVVVLGAGADDVLDAVDFGDAIVAINEDWEEGIASSLRVGVDILERDPALDRTFVALGDQPGIPAEVPGLLVEVAEWSDRPAIVPVYRYERANPVLFDRRLWHRLMALEGDHGASDFLRAHPEWVEEVRVDWPAPRDVDTEDDVADLGRDGRRPGTDGPPNR